MKQLWLYEMHRGYCIWHQPDLKRRPWRAQLIDDPDPARGADKRTLEEARAFIDRQIERRSNETRS